MRLRLEAEVFGFKTILSLYVIILIHISNHVKTLYSKHQKFVLMDQSPVFSLVTYVADILVILGVPDISYVSYFLSGSVNLLEKVLL